MLLAELNRQIHILASILIQPIKLAPLLSNLCLSLLKLLLRPQVIRAPLLTLQLIRHLRLFYLILLVILDPLQRVLILLLQLVNLHSPRMPAIHQIPVSVRLVDSPQTAERHVAERLLKEPLIVCHRALLAHRLHLIALLVDPLVALELHVLDRL